MWKLGEINMKARLSILVAALTIGATIHLSSCSNKTDYVAQCKLTDYVTYTDISSMNFLDKGIGYATVKKYIDGDTTHFYQAESRQRLVKSRYIGVDTPESTGQIEPYGKKAANFTRSTLEKAKTIVLTADVTEIGSPATVDSTGSRYKTFIWYSEKENAKLSDLRLLNLLLVQEGLSTGKGMSGSPLTDYFTNADLQAQDLKLNIWSGKPDPDFDDGEASVTTLEAMAQAYDEDGYETSYNGAKVRFRGIVYKLSGSYDAYLFQEAEDGSRKYGIYIFAGYKSYTPLRTLGAEIEVVGTYTIYMGNPQITNVSYDAFNYNEETDMKIISRDNEYSIDTVGVDVAATRESINMIYKVEELECYSGKTEIDATTEQPSGALTLRCVDSQERELSIRVPEDVWAKDQEGNRITDATFFQGLVLTVIGAINFFAPDEEDPNYGYYQIRLCDSADLTIVRSAI